MPPKGRKKVVTETKNGIYNGAGEVLQVDEVADVGLKELNAQNKIGKSQSGKGRKKTKIVDNEESTEISSNGQISTDVAEEKTKENSSAPAKRGKKKTESKPDDQISTKQDEAQEPKEKSFKPIEQEEKVAPAKRGRKKAEIQSENEISVKQDKMGVPTREKLPDPILDENTNSKVDIDQAKVVPAKRGRKKAEIKSDFQTSVKQRKLEHNEKTFVVEKISAIEVEIPDSEANVVVAKRGRKKAESKDYQTSVKQRKIEHNENTFVVEKVPGSKKREEGDPLNPAPKENEECNTLTSDPRKIRSGRSDKKTEVLTQAGAAIKNVSTAVGGRKRKGEEKTDRKEAKKGKSCAEIPDQKSKSSETEMDNTKHLRVTLQRNLELEEMALLQTEGETKVKSGKGPSKGKGKRANPNGTDSKPEKIPKESTSKSKGSAKKDKIPDVTVLDFGNTSTSPDGKPWNLKIASWNINGIRAWLEKNGMSYLHHEKPDVLCVQETKCSDDKLPDDVKVDGYHCYWLAGDKEGYSGVGLLSKEKPISVRNGIGIEEHDNDGRAITAEYEKFYLVTAYVPNSGRGLVRLNYRIQWDKDFRDYLKKLDEKKPVVLCGDLNVAHEEMDLANPKTNKKNAGFTKEERDAFSTLLSEGFIDTFRHLYPDTKAAYTFWTYMMNARAKNVGWRLDYFVISKKFTNYLCDSVIRKDVFGSDHCPIGLFLHV